MLAGLLAVVIASKVGAVQTTDLSRPNPDGQPTRVEVGLYLSNLYEVSAADETFVADVLLRADWLDPRLARPSEATHEVALDQVWNPRFQCVNQRTVTTLLPQRVEVDASGHVTYRQRWFGRFAARLDLRGFPRDRQRLLVQFVAFGYARDEVDLVVPEKFALLKHPEELSITDWDVEPTVVNVADYQSAPGFPDLPGIQLVWEARRFVEYYLVQVILPLIFIVLMGWIAVWIDPSLVASRVSVAMTTMLTLIAYRFSLGKAVPALTYLTRFDYFMLWSTILIFLMLGCVTVGAHFVQTGRTISVRHIDRWARIVYPAAFAAVCVLAWWG